MENTAAILIQAVDNGGTEQDGDEDDKWSNLKVDLPVDWIEVEF